METASSIHIRRSLRAQLERAQVNADFGPSACEGRDKGEIEEPALPAKVSARTGADGCVTKGLECRQLALKFWVQVGVRCLIRGLKACPRFAPLFSAFGF